MNILLVCVLTNAVVATGMFAIIAACKARIRNPAVLHVLCVLVLLKLLTPPLWNPKLALLPAVEPAAGISTEATPSRDSTARVPSNPQSGNETGTQPFDAFPPEGSLGSAVRESVSDSNARADDQRRVAPAGINPLLPVAVVWGTGSLMWWGLAGWRINRFQRCLRFAREAPAEVQQTTRLLAEQLGLRRVPRVWQVPGRVSPMLWAFVGPVRVVVPVELFADLDGPSREALLLHELAHYRRGDHWIRWLEVVSLGLYWWHPVAWLLRREIRTAEERACDAWVVSRRPDDRRAYAEMLVTTVGFLSSAGVPAVATGVGAKSNIEERLTIIMRTAIDVRVSGRAKVLICLLAILLLPLAPKLVRAQRDDARAPASRGTRATSSRASDGEVKVRESNAANVDVLSGTVVDEEDKPVADIEVVAYLNGQRVERVFKTSETGQFRIPRKWRSDDLDQSVALVVREGENRLGWLDLRCLAGRGSRDQNKVPSNDSFRIVLLARTQMVRGTLVGPDGKPLSEMRVVVDRLMHEANHSLAQHSVGEGKLGDATTDRDGTFTIRLPAGAKVALEPQHPDWLRKQIVVTPEMGDLGRITLARAGRVQGRVVDAATGKPLEGQRVLAQSQDSSQVAQGFVSFGSAVTDRDGHYVLGGLSPGRFNVLFGGSAQGIGGGPPLTAAAFEGVDVSVERPVQADFQASTGRRLSGKVLDSESGKPLAKISVGYYGPARPDSGAACMMVRTSADGTFEFRVPPGVSKVYVADGERQAIAESSRTLEVPADRDLDDIVLQAGQKREGGGIKIQAAAAATDLQPAGSKPYELQVKLQPPAGRKVNKVEARVIHKGSQHSAQWTALSETGNKVSFHRREEGRKTFLLIDAAGFAPARSAEFVVRERMPDVAVELIPEEPVPVRGRVVDQEGKAVAEARVRIARLIYGKEQQFPWGLEYSTGNDGTYEIKHARRGDRIRVRIDKPGTGGAETAWISLDAKEPRVLPDFRVGPPDQELGGIVRDYEGLPVGDAQVIYTGEPRIETRTDAEGKFRLTGLPTGDLSLAIESEGFPRDVRQSRAGKLDNVIRVDRVGKQDEKDYEAAITLRPRDGKDVSRVTLFFCLDGGDLLMSMPDRKGNSHKIRFASLVRAHKDEQFAVVIAADGYERSKPVIVPNQRDPKAVVVDLEPAAPVTLRGRVVDDNGRPVADAKVGLSVSLNDRATDEPWRYFSSREKLPLTDADGLFEIAGILRNSRVAVYINKPGYSGVWSERVSTEKPEDIEWPELRLSRATGELSGRVVDGEGRPVRDAVVYVHDLGRVETTTDAQGRFRLQKVPNREVWLRVQSEHGEWTKKITPDATDVDVKLQTLQ